MNRWMCIVLFVGLCAVIAPSAHACDGVVIAAAPQACVVLDLAAQAAALAPQFVVSPFVAVTPTVTVVPTLVETRSVRLRESAFTVRVRSCGPPLRRRFR